MHDTKPGNRNGPRGLRLPAKANLLISERAGTVCRDCFEVARDADPGATHRTRRVLLVDDDLAVCEGVGRRLRRHVEVVAVSGAARALAHLAEDVAFDVILCDVQMPRMDGPAFFEVLAERRPELMPRVIFWTGGTKLERSFEFRQRLQNLLLVKPVPLAALLDAIERTAPPCRCRVHSLPGAAG